MADGRLFVLGGIGGMDSSETLRLPSTKDKGDEDEDEDLAPIGTEWRTGPSLPRATARACAVAVNKTDIFVIGEAGKNIRINAKLSIFKGGKSYIH